MHPRAASASARRPSFGAGGGSGGGGSPFLGTLPQPTTATTPLSFAQPIPAYQLTGNALLQSLMQHQERLRVLQQQQQQQQAPAASANYTSQQSLELMRLMSQALQSSQSPPAQVQPDFYSYGSAQSTAAASAVAARNSAVAAASGGFHGGSSGPRFTSQAASMPGQTLPARGISTEARGPEGSNLFAYNIPEYFTEQQLQALFHPYGTLLSAKVQRDSSGQSKCYGFVSLTMPEHAELAISHVDGLIIGGKKLSVRIKTTAQEAQ